MEHFAFISNWHPQNTKESLVNCKRVFGAILSVANENKNHIVTSLNVELKPRIKNLRLLKLIS